MVGARRGDHRAERLDGRKQPPPEAFRPAAVLGTSESTDEHGECRPALSTTMTGAEMLRWYWLRTELADLARRLGVSSAGGKTELTERLAAVLDGRPPAASTPRRTPGRVQVGGDLTLDTVIPAGQRCSQALRAFFVGHIGPGFTFDAAMRSFIGDNAGATLGDAVAYWSASRGAPPGEIGGQFELNRFTRQWHREHPGGARADLLRAWAAYRATPTDRRGRV